MHSPFRARVGVDIRKLGLSFNISPPHSHLPSEMGKEL